MVEKVRPVYQNDPKMTISNFRNTDSNWAKKEKMSSFGQLDNQQSQKPTLGSIQLTFYFQTKQTF